jgi:hypothetical protein
VPNSLAQLQNDVMGWLNRRDVAPYVPGWISMVETDINETLRARPMIGRATQAIDADFITLPVDFIAFNAVRDATTGLLLSLEDAFTGSQPRGVTPAYVDQGFVSPAMANGCPSWGYRLDGDCIEFIPHPTIPDPPVPGWQPQMVSISYYQRVTPLRDPQDTNKILDQFYSIYLFGACKYGAMFELDDARAAQMQGAFADAVTQANLWTQASNFSGAPLRAVVRGF